MYKRQVAIQVAPTDMTVLISGESGTGKESFSKIIHSISKRKHGQFIAVNCGAIPEGTIDSELFGHEKGSFTGANESRKGYFEVANKGFINWQAGDYCIWDQHVSHAASNIGIEPRYTLQITGHV